MAGVNDDLEALPFFRSLPSPIRKRLISHSIAHDVGAQTILFEQGKIPTFQKLVLGGLVQLFGRSSSGEEVLIDVVEEQHLVSPAAVITGSPYLMRARVAEPSRLLLMQARIFTEAVFEEPRLARLVIGSLADENRLHVRQIKNLKLRKVNERVGCYLLALSARQGKLKGIVLPYEKKVIATELGISRESFSRALASLFEIGVTVDGQTVSIADAKRLAEEARLDPLIDAPELFEEKHVQLRAGSADRSRPVKSSRKSA